jgi:hypothetical protein
VENFCVKRVTLYFYQKRTQIRRFDESHLFCQKVLTNPAIYAQSYALALRSVPALSPLQNAKYPAAATIAPLSPQSKTGIRIGGGGYCISQRNRTYG